MERLGSAEQLDNRHNAGVGLACDQTADVAADHVRRSLVAVADLEDQSTRRQLIQHRHHLLAVVWLVRKSSGVVLVDDVQDVGNRLGRVDVCRGVLADAADGEHRLVLNPAIAPVPCQCCRSHLTLLRFTNRLITFCGMRRTCTAMPAWSSRLFPSPDTPGSTSAPFGH